MIRVRRSFDGSYWIERFDQETIDYLDGKYVRVLNELRWVNKIPSEMGLYKNLYPNATGFIIGKGPSLDILTRHHFEEPGPVIALNEAIHKAESLDLDHNLYGTQLDNDLAETCRPKKDTTKLFLGPRCDNLYEENTYTVRVNPEVWGLPHNCLSVEYAIMILRHMGCNNLFLYCFDGCIRSDYDYAKCIGYDSARGGSKLRFKEHKGRVLELARNLPVQWVTPTGPKSKSVAGTAAI